MYEPNFSFDKRSEESYFRAAFFTLQGSAARSKKTRGVMHMSHHEKLLMSLYRTIRTIRRFEETGMEKYREGRIHGYFHPCIGEEAVAAGACSALRADDFIVSTHRGHSHCIAKGADMRLMMAELYGKATGYSRGRRFSAFPERTRRSPTIQRSSAWWCRMSGRSRTRFGRSPGKLNPRVSGAARPRPAPPPYSRLHTSVPEER